MKAGIKASDFLTRFSDFLVQSPYPMSVSMQETDSIAQLTAQITGSYLLCVLACLVCYEHVLTLADEFSFFWRRRRIVTTVLLLANRYTLLAMAVQLITPYTTQTLQTCYSNAVHAVLVAILRVLPMIVGTGPAVFGALRVYALLEEHRYLVATLVFCTGLVPAPVSVFSSLYDYYVFADSQAPGMNCYAYPLNLACSIPWTCSDAIALGVTLKKTYRQVKHASKGTPGMISRTLLRDGSLYFVVSFSLNITRIVLLTHTGSQLVMQCVEQIFTNDISQAIRALLISRFIMNLRHAQKKESSSGQVGGPSGLYLRGFTLDDVIADLGGPLEFAHPDSWQNHSELSSIELEQLTTDADAETTLDDGYDARTSSDLQDNDIREEPRDIQVIV
ncbi:hypothetical protein NM688_g1945 [Phlebia brevispora]|uniref:Uncharacterized protein n=1 Tax=Phlebia brevispora TaxID=194682 RepID=A0ACC1TA36_9APHY|nr:hypothetical protein NM688_g1945 [Phlebia brevispora]